MSEALYKIMPASLWARAPSEGRMPWAEVDVRDGFVHLSAASQVRETARRHFASQHGSGQQGELLLLEVDRSALSPGSLRWEPSRGGALFPHVYGDVPLEAVVRVRPLVQAEEGLVFPDEIP